MKKMLFGGHLVFCANLISAVVLERLYRFFLKFGTLIHYKMNKKYELKKLYAQAHY